MKQDHSSPKVNPEHLGRPLVAGCSTSHKSCLSVLDGTWAKLKSQINFSQRCFLPFEVALIMLIYVEVLIFLIILVLISYVML